MERLLVYIFGGFAPPEILAFVMDRYAPVGQDKVVVELPLGRFVGGSVPDEEDKVDGIRPPMDALEDKAAEGHALGQIIGGSPPSEMDKVAEGSASGQVAWGGITDMEDKVGGIVSRLTVEKPVADSSTAFTIPAKEVRPSGHCRDGVDPALGHPAMGLGMGSKAAVGIGGASWGGGTNMGGRGIPWLDRRGRVFPHDPHLLTESKRAATDFCRGIDPG